MRAAWKLLITFVLLAIAVSGGFALWIFYSLKTPHNHNSSEKIITIERGMRSRRVVALLAENGIISSTTPLLAWVYLNNVSKELKAGDYRFASPITPLQAIDKIRRGDVVTRKITIPEGYNRFEIARTLAETGIADEETFLALTSDASLIDDIDPSATSLEGFLFPDTYNYTSRTTAKELIAAMVQRFKRALTPELYRRASELNLTLHQVVTLASIIEEEAKIAEERPIIASVFYNRMSRGMPLASDPTFVYAAILANDYDGDVNNPRHRRRASPYNTYLYAGLPPGPICSPGQASLQAALYPASTDYIYFVVNGTDGLHKFSRTEAEHDRAVAEYRRLQKQLARTNSNGRR